MAGGLIGVPIRVGDRVVGVIEVEAAGPREWVDGEVGAVFDAAGTVAAHLAFEAAIASRDAAWRELEGQREFLDTVIDAIPHPVFVKDRAHRFVVVNRAFSEAWSLPKAGILGHCDADLIGPDRAREACAEDDRVFASVTHVSREMPMRMPGPPSWISRLPAHSKTSAETSQRMPAWTRSRSSWSGEKRWSSQASATM